MVAFIVVMETAMGRQHYSDTQPFLEIKPGICLTHIMEKALILAVLTHTHTVSFGILTRNVENRPEDYDLFSEGSAECCLSSFIFSQRETKLN